MAAISLKGRNVVIGGGAKNLGGLISRTLAADGANIVVHYNSDRTRADAEATIAAVNKAGADAFAIPGRPHEGLRGCPPVRYRGRAVREYRHRHQHGREGAEEALH